jgi:hypothetical protein
MRYDMIILLAPFYNAIQIQTGPEHGRHRWTQGVHGTALRYDMINIVGYAGIGALTLMFMTQLLRFSRPIMNSTKLHLERHSRTWLYLFDALNPLEPSDWQCLWWLCCDGQNWLRFR